MTYRFRDRINGTWQTRQGTTRLAAAIQLPIGSWECVFVESDDDVFLYDPITHDRPFH